MIQNAKLRSLLMEYPLSRKLVCKLHGHEGVQFETTVVEMVLKLDGCGSDAPSPVQQLDDKPPICMSLFGCENFVLRERIDRIGAVPCTEWLELVAV